MFLFPFWKDFHRFFFTFFVLSIVRSSFTGYFFARNEKCIIYRSHTVSCIHKKSYPMNAIHNIYSSINRCETESCISSLSLLLICSALDCRGTIFRIYVVQCSDSFSTLVLCIILYIYFVLMIFIHWKRHGVTFLKDIEFNWQLFSIHKVVFCALLTLFDSSGFVCCIDAFSV